MVAGMPYCPNCGMEVPEDARFCPNCGVALKRGVEVQWRPEAGFGRLVSDRRIQRYWARRVIAYFIDSLLVFVFTVILFAVLTFPLIFTGFLNWMGQWNRLFKFPSITGLVYLLYFSFMESSYGYTFGKKAMDLEVVTAEGGPPTLTAAFIRNLSKVFWAFLLLDVILGLVTAGDPRQRFMDQVAETMVVVRRGRRWRPPPRNSPIPETSDTPPRVREIPKEKRGISFGLANFGAFLIALSVILLLYPSLPSEVVDYLRRWEAWGHPVMPSASILWPLFQFLLLMGLWHLLLAGVSVALGYRGRGVSDIAWGGFLIAVGLLLRGFVLGFITSAMFLPLVLIAFGAMILGLSSFRYFTSIRGS